MEAFWNGLARCNEGLNKLLWGPAALMLILIIGVQFTVRTHFFQVTRLRLWMRHTMGSLFGKKVAKQSGGKGISPFQAMTTALAGAIGTGNIVGVATAITLGGAGAVFWMWVAAFFGMMTIFAENVLGIRYRVKNEQGEWVGGPMYYIERGLKKKWLAVLFAVACMVASFGIGNMTQANSIAGALKEAFGLSPRLTGIILAGLVGVIILGGIHRIAGVTEKVVPFMALFYLVGGLAVIVVNFHTLPGVFQDIFSSAFDMRAAAGGAGGYVIANAIRQGFAKGIFSNEAGLGSSPIVYASAETKEPVEQGMWGIFQVFIDTIVGCTITALCILCSGALGTGKDGVALSTAAFQSVFGRFGSVFVAISIVLFAFATLVSWSFYGERSLSYLAGSRFVPLYKGVYVVMVAVGCVMDLNLVWSVADTFNGLMALPNLVALLLLSGEVVQETRQYLGKKAPIHRKIMNRQTES